MAVPRFRHGWQRVCAPAPMASPAAGSSKPSVDDVWQKLKQEAKPRAPPQTAAGGAAKAAPSVDFNKLWQGFSSDTRPSGKPAAAKKPAVQLEVDQLYKSPARPAAVTAPASASSTVVARQLPDPAAAEQLVARCVAAMKDTSGPTRRRALLDVKVRKRLDHVCILCATCPRVGAMPWHGQLALRMLFSNTVIDHTFSAKQRATGRRVWTPSVRRGVPSRPLMRCVQLEAAGSLLNPERA